MLVPGLPDDPATNKERIIKLETRFENIEGDIKEIKEDIKATRRELGDQIKEISIKVHTIDVNVNKNVVLIGILMVAAQLALQFFLK